MSNKKKKGLFMKIIIIYCLLFIAVTNIWALIIIQTTGYNAYSIINAINLVHGGELLMCCVKKVLSSDDNKIKSSKNINSKSNKIENYENDDFKDNHSDLRGE